MPAQEAPSPTAASCMYCLKPLPQPHAKTRRYCSASCRTGAYNLRASQRVAPPSEEAPAASLAGALGTRGELPLLRSAHQTLEGVSSTLHGLARRFAAEELMLQRELDWVRSQRPRHGELEHSLARARSQLADRDAELAQLRRLLLEADIERLQLRQALRAPTASTPTLSASSLSSTTISSSARPLLTEYAHISVPGRLLDGLTLVASACDIMWKFGQIETQRLSEQVLEGFVAGLYLVNRNVGRAVQNLRAEQAPDGSLAASGLRWRLLHDILPAFDDLYRCVQSMRASSASRTSTPLWNLIEWTFAVFVGVLTRAGLHPLHPLGGRFDPHLHEAAARVERQDMPEGSIIEVSQLGFLLGEKLLRPARVAVACAPPPASGSGSK